VRALGYCARSLAATTRAAIGPRGTLITCPPTTPATLNPQALEVDLLFLNLHGFPQQPYLYGDRWLTALSSANLATLNLSQSVVVVSACFFPSSPIHKRLLSLPLGPPRLLIAGSGPNYTNPSYLSGPALLTLHLRRLLSLHVPPRLALSLSKGLLRLHPPTLAALDTLAFTDLTHLSAGTLRGSAAPTKDTNQ